MYAFRYRGAPEDSLLTVIADGDSQLTEAGTFRPVLLPVNLLGPERTERPLDSAPGLHRIFADTEPSKPAILGFTNRYGTLGLNRTEVNIAPLLRRSSGPAYVPYKCDSLADWSDEILALRHAVDLWSAIRSGESAATEQPWTQLYSLVAPRLQDLEGKLSVLETGEGLVLNVGPKNLCTAAWLQFEREIEGFFDFRRCGQCSRWLRFYPQQVKIEQIFCSQACRSKSYRARQDDARRMNLEGVAVEEIAARLNSNVATVKGWISRRRA